MFRRANLALAQCWCISTCLSAAYRKGIDVVTAAKRITLIRRASCSMSRHMVSSVFAITGLLANSEVAFASHSCHLTLASFHSLKKDRVRFARCPGV